MTIRAKECLESLKLLSGLNLGQGLDQIFKPFDLDDQVALSSMKGRLDLERTYIAGHSFGGGTVVKALGEDNSAFKCGACFDSWMYPVKDEIKELSQAKNPTPLLFINYEKFQWRKNLVNMRNFETDDNVWTVKKATHYVASDLPTIINGSLLRKVVHKAFVTCTAG